MRSFLFACTMVFIMAVAPGRAVAGWTSGGGELFEDAHNPWFIQNTKSVSYCLQFDRAAFHSPEATTRALVREAIEYWKREFSRVGVTHLGSLDGQKGDDFIQIATQSFIEQPCAETTDLRLQFGFLTTEQKDRIPGFRNYASITIRTDYDVVNLRGKGFIFIGADAGMFRMPGVDESHSPWQAGDGSVLFAVLVHEFGHIFGLVHGGDSVMAEDWPEKAVASAPMPIGSQVWKSIKPSYLTFDGSAFFLPICLDPEPKGNFQIGSDLFHRFTGAPKGLTCWRESLENYRYEYWGGTGQKLNLIGSTDFQRNGDAQTEPAVRFFLRPEQRVFIPLAPIKAPLKLQIVDREVVVPLSGIYRSADGRIQRLMTFIARPGGIGVLGGLLDGKLYFDLKGMTASK